MYIKKITGDEFCWISNLQLEFAPCVTMICGKNGSGKSRLLETIYRYAFFASMEGEGDSYKPFFVNLYEDNFPLKTSRDDYFLYEKLSDLFCMEAILKCLYTFAEGLDYLEIPNITKCAKEGHETHVNNVKRFVDYLRKLPFGYKRLLFMVLYMALDSYLHNGSAYVKGVICIDGIDLFLDVELQQTVMDSFVKTFPNAQFIVTTHSPIVLSHLPQDGKNKIVQIIHDGNEYSVMDVDNIYGMDYNSVVSMVMGAHARDPHVKAVKERYIRLMRRGKMDKAIDAALEIKRLFPNNYKDVIKELDSQV